MVRKSVSLILAALVVGLGLVLTAGPALAASDEPVFTETEREIIREVLQQTGVIPDERDGVRVERDDRDKHGDKTKPKNDKSGLPPGLAKKSSLPPGLAKREQLPPGLAKRGLPSDLEARLPRRTATERVIVDGDVILIEKGTEIVLDVIRDVIRD